MSQGVGILSTFVFPITLSKIINLVKLEIKIRMTHII